jgi:hypothetical protein
VTVVNPDQLPTITDVGSDGDVDLEFEIPRAPTVTVGTVTTVAPTDPADVVDIGTDGDVVLDFDIPQGVKGDPGDGVETPIGADGTILVANSATSSGTSWESVSGSAPITYDAATQTVGFDGGLSVLNDVTPGTPADGDILRFDIATGQWVSTDLPEGVSLGLVLALGG